MIWGIIRMSFLNFYIHKVKKKKSPDAESDEVIIIHPFLDRFDYSIDMI